jgi:hypothetical protein
MGLKLAVTASERHLRVPQNTEEVRTFLRERIALTVDVRARDREAGP